MCVSLELALATGNQCLHVPPMEVPDVTKMELAQQIAQLLGVSSSWIEDLAKAQRNGLIAVRNCLLELEKQHKQEQMEWLAREKELIQQLMDLKA